MTLTAKETAPGRATEGGKDQQAADVESILDEPTHKIGPYDFESFARRIIQDCIEQATAAWWLNRARQLEGSVSDPARRVVLTRTDDRGAVTRTDFGVGDFPGRTRTPEQQSERDRQLRATAFACRARAALIQGGWF